MTDAVEVSDSREEARRRLHVVRAGEGSRRPNPAELAVMRILPMPRAWIPPRRRERLDRQLELPFEDLEGRRRQGSDSWQGPR